MSRVTLLRWWWLRPWQQVRILAGNLDACRWAAERFGGHPEYGSRLEWHDQDPQLEVAQRAEEIHAEHHSGVMVPSLDSCPEHTRAEYESLVRRFGRLS